MRNLILYLLITIPVLLQGQQNPFKIKGKLEKADQGSTVFLKYTTKSGDVIDSSTIHDGVFSFEGTIPEITTAVVYIKPTLMQLLNGQRGEADQKALYLDKGEIMITAKDSLKNAVITGSAINEEYLRYQAAIESAEKKFKVIRAELASAPAEKRNDSAFNNQIQARWKEALNEAVENRKLYIQQNPSSFFSLEAVANMLDIKREISEIETYYNTLSATMRNSSLGQRVAKAIDVVHNTSVGAEAPAISLPDSSGKLVSLSDFKHKYVLIDFWASWCQPCRAENPNLVSIYKKYRPQGFEILGISLDEEKYKVKWLEAIKQDGLTWPQVNDAKAANGAVAQSYGINEIPKNFLIGPGGKIVAVNLHGEALHQKLDELLGK